MTIRNKSRVIQRTKANDARVEQAMIQVIASNCEAGEMMLLREFQSQVGELLGITQHPEYWKELKVHEQALTSKRLIEKSQLKRQWMIGPGDQWFTLDNPEAPSRMVDYFERTHGAFILNRNATAAEVAEVNARVRAGDYTQIVVAGEVVNAIVKMVNTETGEERKVKVVDLNA